MKYYKRLEVWKGSNVSFNPATDEAHSYRWWCFVKRINGRLVFNNYTYSNSTSRHQSKVQNLLRTIRSTDNLLMIEAPDGLQDLPSAIEYYEQHIRTLRKEMSNPRSHKRKNIERRESIEWYRNKIDEVQRLIYNDEFDNAMEE